MMPRTVAPTSGTVREPEYRDDGCNVAPACLSCPLPRCKYDAPGYVKKSEQQERSALVGRLRASGMTMPEIASEIGVSLRTAQRAGRDA